MRMIFFLLSLLMAALAAATPAAPAKPANGEPMEIVILGASISRAWQLDEFDERMKRPSIRVRAELEYEFDKSPAIKKVLAQTALPAAVVIKSCGAYFPGDLTLYRSLVQRWVTELRAANVQPVLATVAPVTEKLPPFMAFKQVVKRYVLFRDDAVDHPARLRDLHAYNDWVRDYARRERLPLLDLEAALWIGPAQRYLPVELQTGDSLHLAPEAYARLDRALLQLADTLAAKQVTASSAPR
jgi:hypothetical protein